MFSLDPVKKVVGGGVEYVFGVKPFITWLFPFPLLELYLSWGGVEYAIWIMFYHLVSAPPLFNSIGQKNNGGGGSV